MDTSFHTTCWTEVFQAKGESSESREAMSRLCERYYKPVLSYLSRIECLSEDEAKDVAHEFFARLLSGDRLANATPNKGKFRSYLLGGLKHFLANRWARQQAQKRGGDQVICSVEDMAETIPELSTLPPDRFFDRLWAITLLDRALKELENECVKNGQAELFPQLSPWLTGEAEHGNQLEIADKLSMPVNTVRSSIRRLRKRFRDKVKQEIADTLSEDQAIDEELEILFAALRGE